MPLCTPLTRRDLLRTAAAATAAAPSFLARSAPAGEARSAEGRKLRYVGWQLGVTYQAEEAGGRDRDSVMRLLDEMAGQRMNLLSLMMISYGFYDPKHDGYCWPVRSAKLNHYVDPKAINAQPSTEFVRQVIGAAAERKIEVQLFMNWGIWNPERIRRGYPTATSQASRRQALDGQPSKHWLHCPDSPGAWQAGLDEVADLLAFYKHPNVTSYGLERLSYSGPQACFCTYTQKKYREQTGRAIFDATPAELEAWKGRHVAGYLKQYVEHVERVRPGMEVWLHTQCAPGWGHDPKLLPGAGIDYLVPHTIQFRETKQGTHAKLRRLAPNPCVLHFCTRDRRPANYPLWIKTPEIIAEVIGWALDYPGDNLAGLLFFNENATSPRNKKAVYEAIKRFAW